MFDKTFPTLDCSACILTPKMVELQKHPYITLHTYSEVINIEGSIGNFKVKLLKKPRYVIEDKCTGCGDCAEHCPIIVPNEFELGMAPRKAVYIPFPLAVPLIYTIDKDNCIECGICKKVCLPEALNYDQQPEEIELDISSIIIATGYDLFDPSVYKQFGFGVYENVITGLQMERLFSSFGPTNGEVKRPSDLKEPKKIAFIQCVGSRDSNHGKDYCSRVCCMVSIKQAVLAKEHIPDCTIYIFYIDIRAFGKYFEEFYNIAKERYNINFIRGKVAEIKENAETKNLIVKVENTETGEFIKKEVDLAILSVGSKISKGSIQIKNILENKFRVMFVRDDGYFIQIDTEISSVDTNIPGIFVTGFASGPRDIPDSVAYSSAAATRAALFAKEVKKVGRK